ncbi:MAG: PIN domain-containing protein [Actinobacteria bacterium]|nr:PIN domain-containing protein [Actinomycetota bacterium]
MGLTVLDAQALIAVLRDEPAADAVSDLIRAGDTAMTPVNVAEVSDFLIRRAGASAERSRAILQTIIPDPVRLLTVGLDQVHRTGMLRATHYDRSRRPVSLADCVLLASCGPHDRIATADHALLGVAKAAGIGAVALPRGATAADR